MPRPNSTPRRWRRGAPTTTSSSRRSVDRRGETRTHGSPGGSKGSLTCPSLADSGADGDGESTERTVAIGAGRRPASSAGDRLPPPTWCSTSARSTRPRTACCACSSPSTASGSSPPSRSSATCTAAPRSCSRCATTGRSSCWPTGTTGCRRSPTSSAWCSPSSGCWAWRCRCARSGCAPLLAELNRVLNHLMFLGSYPLEIGAITPIFYAFRERETLQAVMEEVSGGRMHYMFNRVGGLKEELPAGWTGPRPARRSPTVRTPAARPREPRSAATRSSGPAPAASACCRRTLVRAYGVSRAGRPRLRASTSTCAATSRTSPTASCDVPVVTRTEGDCLARFECLLDQVVRLARPGRRVPATGCRPAAGPVNVRLPKVVKAPEGAHLRLDREPARHQRLLPGVPRREDAVAAQAALRVVQQRPGADRAAARLPWSPDMVAILGSMFFVVGDIDK